MIVEFFKMAAAAILDFQICEILLSDGVWRAQTHNCAKFRHNRRSIAEILWFFEFSRWPPPPSWIFEIAKFYWLLESRGWRRISRPNFVKFGQSVAKTLRFFDFSRWRPSPSWISKSWTFICWRYLELSLIHIWRCRRSTLCRSRWSPYH